ncbi:MAG: hypothetical protein JXK04_06520 [Campylobacterales bacterium]|nr:hypothetical protein [Campylobacterales bacterium]
MKNLALTMIMSVAGVALSAEEYTIQTISALKESSITPAFEKKVQKSALPVTKKKEGACNVVTVGRYDNPKKAHADLAKAKAVAKDAFVRPLNRTVPRVCAPVVAEQKATKTPLAHSAIISASAPAAAAKTKEAVKAAVAPEAAAITAEPSAKPSIAAVVEQKTPAVKTEETKEAVSDQMSSAAIFIYDRNLARKSDIHDAIEYYKNSPYHTFKPVAMQK